MDVALQRYIEDHLPDYPEDLKRLCRQPSVAAQNQGIQECAQLTRQMLEEIGFPAQVLPTRDSRFYRHYDIRHVELISWASSNCSPGICGFVPHGDALERTATSMPAVSSYEGKASAHDHDLLPQGGLGSLRI